MRAKAINPFTDFGFEKAFNRAQEVNLTREEKMAYEESLKNYRDNINVIDTAREEGVYQMIKEFMDVLDDETLALKSKLSIEEIRQLRKEYMN